MTLIIPSIIAKNQKELDARLKKVSPFWKLVQLDIMDGTLVKSTSLDFNFRLEKGIRYEAHLMIKNPSDWIIEDPGNVESIIFPLESPGNPLEVIKMIKRMKKKVGIAIHPTTPVSALTPYLSLIDKAVIMTVNPGRYGARFLPKTLQKVIQARKISKTLTLQTDGGMNPQTIPLALKAGADEIVVGSYIQQSINTRQAADELQSLIRK